MVDSVRRNKEHKKMVEKDKLTLSDKHQIHKAEMWPMQNWRAWGSWFSWGSPVGLGLFAVLIAFAVWILFHL
jgi:hypothetical protein